MSEIKHTPGPWNAKHNGQYWEIRGPEIGYFSEQIGDACASEFIGGMKANPVSEANARLIAAAPELLERLEELLEYSEILRGSAVYKRAQDAISKARGAA